MSNHFLLDLATAHIENFQVEALLLQRGMLLKAGYINRSACSLGVELSLSEALNIVKNIPRIKAFNVIVIVWSF
ncbi:MAG: hypothetical protein COA50_16625 [Flavobacteriaceae bacterium]|nr:MAG: hypothetical protein COA50_16625 [Flavobacteriaceae bacterium]